MKKDENDQSSNKKSRLSDNQVLDELYEEVSEDKR